MTFQDLSASVFDLAKRFNIPVTPGQDTLISDEDFQGFSEGYLRLARTRDLAVKRHLQATPTLFRVFLSYNPRVYALAQQIMWYLDQVIVRDPIDRLLTLLSGLPVETRKKDLVNALQLLSHFRPYVKSGYLIFVGDSLLQQPVSQADDSVLAALDNSRIKAALEHASEFGLTRVKDEVGNDYTRYEVYLPDVGGLVGFSGHLAGGSHEILTVGERLQPASLNEVEPFLQASWRSDLYPTAIARIVNSFESGRSMGAAILFDRELAGTVLDELQESARGVAPQLASVASFNVTLPFVDHVPPERLMEVREETPEAFRDFRSQMYQIVKDASSLGQLSQDELQEEVNRRVRSQLRLLDSEMRTISRRKRLLGVGLPGISGLGILAGAILHSPPLVLLTLAGVLAGTKQIVDAMGDETKQEANPFYFLWRVSRN